MRSVYEGFVGICIRKWKRAVQFGVYSFNDDVETVTPRFGSSTSAPISRPRFALVASQHTVYCQYVAEI